MSQLTREHIASGLLPSPALPDGMPQAAGPPVRVCTVSSHLGRTRHHRAAATLTTIDHMLHDTPDGVLVVRPSRCVPRLAGGSLGDDQVMSEDVGVPVRQFEDIISKLPAYLRELAESVYLRMDTPAQRRSLRSDLAARQGVYVLYEDDRPMYVGRSNRLADRLLEHGQPANGPESATFAFNLAYQQWHPETDVTNFSRQERQVFKSAPEYGSLFDDAKLRVRKMCVRAVEIEDPVEQAVFELYAHVELKTPYNSFKNH